MKDIKISADSLDVGYAHPIIKDIAFNVRGGEIMTLIGPNGSGKSTILKTLAGELKKLGGRVSLCGADSEAITRKEKAKKLSLLMTGRVSTELMTCREVIETGRYPYTGYFGTLSENDKKAVDEAVRLVGVYEFADSDFNALSDGQRQRVMLARAICQEPEILLLDEPTSYLDIHHKIAFLEILRRLAWEKQIAVIVSMHELDFAEEISDYTVCVKDGAVFASGKPGEIFVRETIKQLFDISDEMFKIYFNQKKGSKTE